ncbi:MAG TPA: hypothetical protein VNW06_09805, partial [Cytophagaceae bacterium]|nr:hypothetical protein [Cytophagaceae bacterium]
MKKLLLLALSSLSSVAMAQISTSFSPPIGCPNSTSDVSVSVTNTSSSAVSGIMTLSLALKSNTSTILGSYTGSPGSFAAGETKSFVILGVAFAGPMTCTIDGSISGVTTMISPFPPYTPMPFPFTIPIPAQNYTVAAPADIALTNTGTSMSVVSVPVSTTVRYYLNGDYSTVIDESSTGNYSATANGSYTAKAYDASYSCFSENPSNTVVISTITAVKEASNIQVSIYPNPVASSVTIETGSASAL